jgi:hypothetical protein
VSGGARSVWDIFKKRAQRGPQGQAKLQHAMKHPVRSDFHSVVTEAGVSVTFKPTNSVYSFYRLADANDIARLGPVSFAGVQHAGRGTEDYPSDEVQNMAQRIAPDFAASVWFQERQPLTGVRNATTDDTTRPVSLASVRDAGSSGNTKARRIVSQVEERRA